MGKITYKIDRLSNNELEFGLKTGAKLTGSIGGLTAGSKMFYDQEYDLSGNGNDTALIYKGYLDDILTSFDADRVIARLKNLIVAGNEITVTNNWGTSTDADPTVTISLKQIEGGGKTVVPDGDTEVIANKVLTGVVRDNYGRVTGVTARQISVSDLDITANTGLDNYMQWNVKVGSGTTSTTNTFAIGSGATINDSTHKGQISDLELQAITAASTINLQFLAGNGLTVSPSTSSSVPQVTYGLDLLQNGPVVVDTNGKITLETLSNSATTTQTFKKFSWDSYGRITGVADVAHADIDEFISTFDGTVAGYVPVKESSNTEDATTETSFLTSSGNWATIPYNKVKAEALSTGNNSFKVLLAKEDDETETTAYKASNVKITGAGALTADSFSGKATGLTEIPAAQLTGKIPSGVIKNSKSDIKEMVFGSNTLTSGSVVIAGTENNTLKTLPNASTEGDWVLTSSSKQGTYTPGWVNISQLVGDIAADVVSQTGGFVFKGLLKTTAATGYVTLDTTTFKRGYFYRVAEAGTYAGHECEVGDAIYAIKDYDSSYTDATANGYWGVLEQNLTDAVTYNSAVSTGGVVAIKTSGGKTISDGFEASKTSGEWTLSANITGNAGTADKWSTARTIAGLTIDGSGDVNNDLAVENITSISVGTTAGDIGSASKRFVNVYATTFYGDLTGDVSGNASTADKVNNKLTIRGVGTSDIEYDGSAAKTITFSAANLGVLKSISNPTARSTTNSAMTALSFSKANDGTVTTTATYEEFLKSFTSSIFNVSTATGAVTMNFKSASTAGTFDTSTTNPTATDRLNYNGYLYATKLYSGAKEVATLATNSTNNAIAILDTEGHYISSGKTIVTSQTTNNDTSVLTSAATHSLVSENMATALKCLELAFSTSSVTSTLSLPANTLVEHIDVVIGSGYSAGTLAITQGSNTYVSTTDIDLTGSGDVFTYKIASKTTTSGAITVQLSDATAGSGVAYIYYK